LFFSAALFAFGAAGHATVFATVHGVVHDSQHRPVTGAAITFQAADSSFFLTAKTVLDAPPSTSQPAMTLVRD